MKVRVVHTGSRDHYQVAASFAESLNLEKLITSGYYKHDAKFLRWIGGERRFASRRSPIVSDENVDSQLFVDVTKMIASKVGLERIICMEAEKIFGQYAASHTTGVDVVLAYNYLAHIIFPRVNTKKVLFQCHPNPVALNDPIFDHVDLATTGFSLEREIAWGPSYRAKLETEWLLADQIIVASSFVKKSLILAGASESKIHINPYGCGHIANRQPRTRLKGARKKLLFVGQLVWRKGADLLPAIAQENRLDTDVIVVTRGIFDSNIMKDLVGLDNVEVYRNASPKHLNELYDSSDALLFPSRFEGYGLVINEALSHGLPVISSSYTAFSDIWPTHGTGVLLKDLTIESIQEAIETIMDTTAYNEASEQAIKFSRVNSWGKFRERNRKIALGESENIS